MSQSNANVLGTLKEVKLPWRDWILLPVLSLLTICLIAGTFELAARQLLHKNKGTIAECLIRTPADGVRGIPNCVCQEEKFEIKPVENRLNACGHRAGMGCGPKVPDAYRIVMTGSSLAEGADVQRERTFAALLPAELSQQTGRKVELYNEGLSGNNPRNVALHFKDVLAAHPNIILWVLTPHDIENVDPVPDPHASTKSGRIGYALDRIRRAFAGKSLPEAAADLLSPIQNRIEAGWEESASRVLLLHFLYLDSPGFVKLYLKGEEHAGFLKKNPDSRWQDYLQQFDRFAADVEGQAQAAGVPLVAVMVPNRAQAVMLSMGEWPEGYDPYKMNSELQSIITRHGGTYIDILPDYRRISNPEQGYLQVDGHPNEDGHAMISRMLAKELTSGAVPQLGVAAHRSQTALERHK